MADHLTVDKADRRVYTASFEDGLVDIFLSSVVLMYAVAPFLSVYLGDFWSSAVFVPFWLGIFLLLYGIHRIYIRPRRGIVNYGKRRKRKLTWFTGIMLILNVLFMILAILGSIRPNQPGSVFVFPFIAMVLLSFTLAGYFLDVTRLYLYGAMLAVSPIIGEWLYREFGVVHHGFPITFGISAIIIFLFGVIKLVTFVRGNPIPEEESLLQG